MLESRFQHRLITELKEMFPGCIVMKSDSGYIQGIPDLLILYQDKWASLECKNGAKSRILCWANERDVFLSFYKPGKQGGSFT